MGGLPKRLKKGKHKRKNIDDNIIWLYPKEHYVAHKLLALENPNCSELQRAWNIMHHTRDGIAINEEEYSLLRYQYSNTNSGEKAPFYNKKQSLEYCKEISKRVSGNGNPMYGKTGELSPRSVKIIDLETDIIYGSLREASRKLNVSVTAMFNYVNKNRELEGHNFIYYDEYLKRKEGDNNV